MLVNPYGNVDQSGWVLVYSIKGGGLVLKSIWVTTDLINTIGRKLWNLHEIWCDNILVYREAAVDWKMEFKQLILLIFQGHQWTLYSAISRKDGDK